MDQINRVREVNEIMAPPGNLLESLKEGVARINTVSELINNIEFVLFGRMGMPTTSKSRTITKGIAGRRLPGNRPPTHPGEKLLEEFVKPLELTQVELARRLGVSYPRLNEIIKKKRSTTPDTALRLSRV